jgi:hypothetical protein
MLRRTFLAIVVAMGIGVLTAPVTAAPQGFYWVSLYDQPDGSLQCEISWYGYILDKIEWGVVGGWGEDYYVPPSMQNNSPHTVILGNIPNGSWFSGNEIYAGGWRLNVLGPYTEDPAP